MPQVRTPTGSTYRYVAFTRPQVDVAAGTGALHIGKLDCVTGPPGARAAAGATGVASESVETGGVRAQVPGCAGAFHPAR